MGSVLGKTSSLSSRIPHSSLDINFKRMGYFRWGGQHSKDQEVRQKQVRFRRCKFSPSGLEHNVCVFALCVCVCVCVCVLMRAPLWASVSSFLLWFWPHRAVTKMTEHLIQCLGSALAGYNQGLINIVCVRAQSHLALCDPID